MGCPGGARQLPGWRHGRASEQPCRGEGVEGQWSQGRLRGFDRNAGGLSLQAGRSAKAGLAMAGQTDGNAGFMDHRHFQRGSGFEDHFAEG